MAVVFGPERPMAAARELTKLHETLYRGTIDEVRRLIAEDSGADKGEYTLVVGGGEHRAEPPVAELERVVGILLTELAPSQAAQLASRITGVRRGEAYAIAQRLRSGLD